MQYANEDPRSDRRRAVYKYFNNYVVKHPEVMLKYIANRTKWNKLNVIQIRQQVKKALAEAKETNNSADTSTQGQRGAANIHTRKEQMYLRLIRTEMTLLWEADYNNWKLKRDLEAKTRHLREMAEARAMVKFNAMTTIRRLQADAEFTMLRVKRDLEEKDEELHVMARAMLRAARIVRQVKRDLEAKTRELQAMAQARAMLQANAESTIQRVQEDCRKAYSENQELRENLAMANEELQMLRMQVKWKNDSTQAK